MEKELMRVGEYGDWGAGGSLSNATDQAPGYPVMDGRRAIAWFIIRDDAEAFVRLRNGNNGSE